LQRRLAANPAAPAWLRLAAGGERLAQDITGLVRLPFALERAECTIEAPAEEITDSEN
jgi:hypothetical protein